VKAVTARYTAVELITRREKVRSEAKDLLKQRLLMYHINVDDFSIVNFEFSSSSCRQSRQSRQLNSSPLKCKETSRG
jgi:prohibitin 2